MAFGLTEPDAGSNPLEMTSTYRRDGDRFLLNGVKYLISNGGIADAVIAFAYPDGKTGNERRISAFIVDTAGATFEREDLPAKLGMPTANTGMFEMTDHPVPVENLLGEEGNGFRIAMATLVSGRLSVAAGCLGVIEDCLAEVLDYCRTRHQHGKPIGQHQLVQEHVAQIEMARAGERRDGRAGGGGEGRKRRDSRATRSWRRRPICTWPRPSSSPRTRPGTRPIGRCKCSAAAAGRSSIASAGICKMSASAGSTKGPTRF